MIGKGGSILHIRAQILPWNASDCGEIAVFVVASDGDALSGITGEPHGRFAHDISKIGACQRNQRVTVGSDLPSDVSERISLSSYIFSIDNILFDIGKINAGNPCVSLVVTGVIVADNPDGVAGFFEGGVGAAGNLIDIDVRDVRACLESS